MSNLQTAQRLQTNIVSGAAQSTPAIATKSDIVGLTMTKPTDNKVTPAQLQCAR